MSEHTPLTEDEVESIDQWMNDHMYGHQISNSYAGMSCGGRCRKLALGIAVNRVLAARTSTATADTGLRERVEAALKLVSGEMSAAAYLTLTQALRNATPASTEDRADNEGTRE